MDEKPIPYYAFNDEGEQVHDYDYGDDDADETADMPWRVSKPNRYVVALYELDRAYGGPEEGGWYYTTGDFRRMLKVFKDKDKAYRYVRRFNHWLSILAKPRYDIGSALYAGGTYSASVYGDFAPSQFPEERPHYE